MPKALAPANTMHVNLLPRRWSNRPSHCRQIQEMQRTANFKKGCQTVTNLVFLVSQTFILLLFQHAPESFEEF